MILCDFFPLYRFQLGKCFLGTEENLNKETFVFFFLIEKALFFNLIIIYNRKNDTEPWKHTLHPRDRPSTCEIILSFWMFTLFCEEIRQVTIKFYLLFFSFQQYKNWLDNCHGITNKIWENYGIFICILE